MKKALRQRTLRVHFGEPEDFMATSFLHDGPSEEEETKPNEETRARNEVKARLSGALAADDVSMLKHLMVEVPELVEVHLDRPLAHLAAQHGALKILQECVSKPADSINSVSSDFEATTPLFWAIKEGQADVTDWLLSNGAFHQPLNVYQDSAVYVAVYYNQVHILDVLKTRRCDCNIPNRSCDLPLMHVIRTGNIAALDRLIEMGVDIYGRTIDREVFDLEREKVAHPVLFEAVRHFTTPVVLQHIFDSSEFNAFAQQPLLCQLITAAIWYDHVELVLFLLNYIYDDKILVDIQVEAIKCAALQVLKMLIVDKGEMPDINCAIRAGCLDVLRLIVEKVTDLHRVPVVYLCIRTCWEKSGGRFSNDVKLRIHLETLTKLQLLVDHGASMVLPGGESRMTPIFFACKTSHVCLVLWLMRAGCDVTSSGEQLTPLGASLNALFSYFLNSNMLKMAYLLASFLPSHNDPAIAVYLSKASFADTAHTKPNYLSSTQKNDLIAEFNEFLTAKVNNAKSLLHLSRLTILGSLGRNAHKRVGSLGLPVQVKQYIQLQDLEDMCRCIGQKAAFSPESVEEETCLCFEGSALGITA